MSVKVKICGVTRVGDALLASDMGASAVGFVFWKKSPRYIDPDSARVIAGVLPPDVAAVGVFVDPAPQHLADVVAHVGLTAVQLHGDETPEYCGTLPYRMVKAVPVKDAADVEKATGWPASITLLLDVADPVRRGGTGRSIDWELASRVAGGRRVFLGGGLTATNVGEAVRRVRPYGVDVSSGVEMAPGVKAPDRMRAFFEAVSMTGSLPEEGTRWATEIQE